MPLDARLENPNASVVKLSEEFEYRNRSAEISGDHNILSLFGQTIHLDSRRCLERFAYRSLAIQNTNSADMSTAGVAQCKFKRVTINRGFSFHFTVQSHSEVPHYCGDILNLCGKRKYTEVNEFM